MYLRDKYGKVIGRVVDTGSGDMKLYDSIGSYIGSYSSSNDSTYNKFGAYYGSGNLLTLLLNEP